MKKQFKIFIKITVLFLLVIPYSAFSQLRSVAMKIQLKTDENKIPSLFYMLDDTVIYDLGTGSEGIYDLCIPGSQVKNDATFVVQSEDHWVKITTIEQLETNGVCKNGTITLTLLEIKRIYKGEPVDVREYKTPPTPHQRALLNDGSQDTGFTFLLDSLRQSTLLLLVTSTTEDSLYCLSFLPKQAFDGTYYTDNLVLKYPKASCIDKTMDSLQSEFCECYLQCLNEETVNPTISTMTFIIDEKGSLRGVFFFLNKEKQKSGVNIATKILDCFQNESFYPAKDMESGELVPDLFELHTGCGFK